MTGKKKMIFYIGSLARGGAQRVMLNLTEALLAKGHQVVVVTTAQVEDEYPLPTGAKRILSDLIGEERKKGRIGNFIRRFTKLRRIWKKEGPDVVISFIGKNNIMAILTSLGLRFPVLVSVRGEPGEEYYSRVLRLCAKYLFPLASGVILQTQDSKAFFSPKVVQKAVVLPNPLNAVFLENKKEKSKEDKAGTAAKSDSPDRMRKTMVMVGRIDANKNQRLVIDAFRQLAEEFPKALLEIWGEGEEREKLIRYVKEIKLEDQILLPGTTGEVKKKLEAADIYLLSSNTEGMPNSLMEAMAMGLPVISTDCPCGGPKMLIQHGVNGLLVPVGDTEKMAAAMKKLLEDEAFARDLGKKALEIRERLNPVRVNEQWEEYILSHCR